MNPLTQKILVIVFIFAGEALSIYAEMAGARTNSLLQQPFMQIFAKLFIFILVGSALLLAGYMLGFSAFKNIWIVSVTSITSILIIEPVLAYAFFQQLPTTGALIGLILGALGFLSAMIW